MGKTGDGNKISALVVDDSALMRNLLTRVLESAPDIAVAGTAMNGAFALRKIEQLHPDVIVLDLEMPEMNGIEFLKERRRRGIGTPVIILSSLAERGARITMEALSLGAADFLLKPSGALTTHDLRGTAVELLDLVRALGRKERGHDTEQQIETRDRGKGAKPPAAEPDARREEPARPPDLPPRPSGPVDAVAIGISTGGPNALREVFPRLDAGLQAPLLVVQHMPAGFTSEFAESLAKVCPLEVKEAKDGDLVHAGRVLIAPGNAHLVVESRPLAVVARLLDAAPVNGHKPSVGVLFTSIAKVYGARSLAVIMTGMGRDGAAEIGMVYREGGVTVAQDEATSVVFGMPKVAIDNGYVRHVLPLGSIADIINRLCRASRDG